jgi:hypothetical protein
MEAFLDSFVDKQRSTIGERALRLSEERNVKKQVLKEVGDSRPTGRPAKRRGSKAGSEFPSVTLTGEDNDEFLLVLDYLESSHLNLSSLSLKYESQNPSVVINREELCQRFNLSPGDATPLLVQMVEARLKNLQTQ